MATQQGMGLFGMPSVEEARQQYEQGLMLTPAQMGSQGLLQQVVSTIGQGGALAGYGLGRMMGGRAAQEAEAMSMEEAMREVTAMGITDPAKKMTALADALQKRGLSRAAMQALEKGRAYSLEDIQRRAAEGRLKQLTPIYGPTVVRTDEMGKSISMKPIIGYIDGEGKRYSVEQAKSMFPGQVVDETVPPPKEGAPKTPQELAAAERARREAAAKDKGKEPPKTPITTKADFEQRYREATETSEMIAIINEAIKNGVVSQEDAVKIIKEIDAKRPKARPIKQLKPAEPVGLPPIMDQPVGGA